MSGRHDEQQLVLEERPALEPDRLRHVSHDCEVDLPRRQRGERVVRRLRDDADVDPRMPRVEPREEGRQPFVAGVALGGDPQPAAATGDVLAHVLGERVQLAEDRSGAIDQQPPRLGEHQPALESQEERHAERGLDLAQLVAERRLAQMKPVRGAGEAALVDDREQ